VAGRSGGARWDYDNSTENNAFFGHTGTGSDWDAAFGTPMVNAGVLVTQDSGAIREYNGPGEGVQAGSDERFGAVSDDVIFQNRAVYYKFAMTRREGASWSGASSYDFTAEKYLFGVPTAVNPATGNREFAIHDLGGGQWSFSGIQPVTGRTYTLVAKLDFQANVAALYVDPNLALSEAQNTPVATYAHTSANWSSAVRLASGGSGQVEWDNLRVSHDWDGLTDGPPIAHDDEATMPRLAKARLQVLANDEGSINPASIVISQPPTHGTATVSADGSILYEHTIGAPLTDSFSYQIFSPDGLLNDSADVTITLTTDARFDSSFVTMPSTAPVAALRVEEAFPGITFDSPHGFSSVPGDAEKIFVTEGDGRVFLIPDVSVPEKILILDHTAAVDHDNNEHALKGIAAHPQWAQNGYIYVTYNSTLGTVRLSRFTCQTTPPYAAGSELILIEQDSDDTVHNIASCHFGPDGYLYVGFGDEGTQSDGHNNAQHVDRNLWSCVIRIDVDKKVGSLPPNANPGLDPYAGPDPGGQSNDADLVIPRLGGGSSGEAHYAIPPDNPLVGATMFNGVALNPSHVRTEIVVMGVRNPWQFSAEDHDANGTVDEIWVGDVGRNDREEINRFQFGNNGGWSWREGSVAGVRSAQLLNGASEAAATLTAPLWEYEHGGGAFEGSSVTGGFVYRGSALPGFSGKYVFADFMSGNIWTLDSSGPAPVVERVAGEVAIVAMMADPSNGDILLLDRGNVGMAQGTGSIKRLTFRAANGSLPSTLSATNFFADLTNLTANPGGHFYEPNLRFWSDFAEKKRWFLIPDSAATIGYSQDAPWSYPSGMVWVKHFDYPTAWESISRTINGQVYSDRRPVTGSPRRRLETRFLVRNDSGAYGISYRWENLNGGSQNDAMLVDDAGASFNIEITVDGNPTTANWQIPSRTNCMTCHTPEAGHALSFNTRQLNKLGSVAGVAGNMIDVLGLTGYLINGPSSTVGLPRHFRSDEISASLESRVRSYLDVNCAYCHQSGGTGGGNWDGRGHLTLAQTGLIKGIPSDAPLHVGDLLVVPALPEKSILFNRTAAANGYSRMPPLATSYVDLEGAQLIADWIAQEVEPHLSYQEWRIANFGDGTSPAGNPLANPDNDRFHNAGEWTFGTGPHQPGDTESITTVLHVQPDAGVFRFSHPRLKGFNTAGISYRYETSSDLISWTEVVPIFESAAQMPEKPDYETATLRLPASAIAGRNRLFVRITSTSP
jgi:glucose/arabinose dehydrogenase/mono/diheme cytochrome c family protein